MSKIHYDQTYFDWQVEIGKFGGRADLIKFQPHIGPGDKVIDFGCGSGYLLKNLVCKDRLGVEINPSARQFAKAQGIKTVSDVRKIPDNWADVIISNNALEHTFNPLQIITGLYAKLKKKGQIIVVIPCDSIMYKFDPNDINKHLFSWSPMNAGNLFAQAGFKVINVSPFFHKWPRHYQLVEKIFGLQLFHLFARIKGYFSREWTQVKIIAIKE